MNFMVSFGELEVYQAVFGQVNNMPNARMNIITQPALIRAIARLAYSEKFTFPFKVRLSGFVAQYVAKVIARSVSAFNANDAICVVLLADQLCCEDGGLSLRLKQMLNEVRIVYYLTDLVAKDQWKQRLVRGEFEAVDLVASFDRGDANRYGLLYHFFPYSIPDGEIAGIDLLYDVFFIGQAKDRLHKIIDVANRLNEAGLRCFFYVTGVNKIDQVRIPGVVYGEPMGYGASLEYLAASRCLLEIVQDGAGDSTLRLSEAVAYGKLLLTDNASIEANPYYAPDQVSRFTSADDIDIAFIRRRDHIIQNADSRITPESFLNVIETELAQGQ